MIMQAEISNTRGEDSSCGDVTPVTFLPSSFRSPPVGPQVLTLYCYYLQNPFNALDMLGFQTLWASFEVYFLDLLGWGFGDKANVKDYSPEAKRRLASKLLARSLCNKKNIRVTRTIRIIV